MRKKTRRHWVPVGKEEAISRGMEWPSGQNIMKRSTSEGMRKGDEEQLRR